MRRKVVKQIGINLIEQGNICKLSIVYLYNNK